MGGLWVLGIGFLLFVVLPRMAEDLARAPFRGDDAMLPPKDIFVFDDPELGEARYDRDAKSLEVEAMHQGRPIPLHLRRTDDMPAGLDLLRSLRRDFDSRERQAREVCARDLLAEVNADGLLKEPLDSEGFNARLTLQWLLAESDGSYRFVYRFDEGCGSPFVAVDGTLAEGPVSAEFG